jgi:hypothetical protein
VKTVIQYIVIMTGNDQAKVVVIEESLKETHGNLGMLLSYSIEPDLSHASILYYYHSRSRLI